MDTFFSYNLLRKTTTNFLDIFNNIKVAKYNSNKEIEKYIKVPLMLAPKQKFYYWLYKRNKEKSFPMIAVNMENIDPATEERGVNKNTKIFVNDERGQYYVSPVPVTVSYQMSIVSLTQGEMDQIIEQIIPYFNPNIFFRLNIPEINNYHDCKVILNTCGLDTDLEISEDNYKLVNWNLSFDVHSYLYKPVQDTNIIRESNMVLKNYDTLLTFETIINDGFMDENGIITSEETIIFGDKDE